MYIAICDDEITYIEQLEEYLVRLRDIYHNLRWKVFKNAENIFEFYQRNGNKFDILITDIELDNISGVELANAIRERDKNIIIFFLTNYKEYAIQCFRAEPLNFWVKPVSYDVLCEDFKRAYSRITQSQEYIPIIENRQIKEVKYCDIIYLEKWERKTIVHTPIYDYKTNKSLSDFQKNLDMKLFARIYQTYIINLSYVVNFSNSGVKLKGVNEMLPIGRTYLEEFKKKLIRYKERRLLGR